METKTEKHFPLNEFGVIDSASSLDKAALAFNSITLAGKNAAAAQKKYDEALKGAKHKFGGHGYDDRGFETNIYNDIGDEIDDFWNKNVVTEKDWRH